MGPNSDTGKGTLYINGEPLAEVGEIKIPLEVEPSDLPPILANVSNENQIVQPPLLFFILSNDRLQSLIGGGIGIAFTVLPRFSSHDLSTSHLKQ